MKTIAIFILALLLLFAGCIKTGGASEKEGTHTEGGQTDKFKNSLWVI